MWDCGLDSFDSGQESIVGSCEHKRQGISWLSAWLLAFQERICPMELGTVSQVWR